jgi:hypothetical protein
MSPNVEKEDGSPAPCGVIAAAYRYGKQLPRAAIKYASLFHNLQPIDLDPQAGFV